MKGEGARVGEMKECAQRGREARALGEQREVAQGDKAMRMLRACRDPRRRWRAAWMLSGREICCARELAWLSWSRARERNTARRFGARKRSAARSARAVLRAQGNREGRVVLRVDRDGSRNT